MARFFKLKSVVGDYSFTTKGKGWINVDLITRTHDDDMLELLHVWLGGSDKCITLTGDDRKHILAILDESEGFV